MVMQCKGGGLTKKSTIIVIIAQQGYLHHPHTHILVQTHTQTQTSDWIFLSFSGGGKLKFVTEHSFFCLFDSAHIMFLLVRSHETHNLDEDLHSLWGRSKGYLVCTVCCKHFSSRSPGAYWHFGLGIPGSRYE